MRIRWRGLELPNQIVMDRSGSSEHFGRFMVEPFERGFGTTVGNSLRRIMLSALEGAAITACKIEGASHEFMAMPHILEDMADILLNIKQVVVRCDADDTRIATIDVEGPQPGGSPRIITAADIKADSEVDVLNKAQHIATLTGPARFKIELRIRKGRGFVPATEQYDREEQELGVIPLDANYSPIARVRYHTEDTRVGNRTDYDRLILEVWTKGTISPEMAVVESAKIMRKHLSPFVQYYDLGEQVSEQPVESMPAMIDQATNTKLDMSIHDLELSVRATNCLEGAKILKLRDLVSRSENELLGVRSFGKTSLREVKRKLMAIGLTLGMQLGGEAGG